MVKTACLGFPRIGAGRELKKALEAYWSNKISQDDLLAEAQKIRTTNWQWQKEAGVDFIPSNDFSLYDHVLDMMFLLDIIPERYRQLNFDDELDCYFAMARGCQSGDKDMPAMEMSKWFDTNYHYIVPELNASTTFNFKNNGVISSQILQHFEQAQNQHIHSRPVLIGPFSFLKLAKCEEKFNRFELLEKMIPVYAEILTELRQKGCEWLQMDEPYLAMDLDTDGKQCFLETYQKLSSFSHGCKIMLTTYFSGLRENIEIINQIQTDGLHIDLTSDHKQLKPVMKHWPHEKTLSLGVIDGRNVWANNYIASMKCIKKGVRKFGKKNIVVATSSSLLHSPIDVELETNISDEIKMWLSFAKQKLNESSELATCINNKDVAKKITKANKKIIKSRRHSDLVTNKAVQKSVRRASKLLKAKRADYLTRRQIQQAMLQLPLMPTTTIGSLPQTSDIRKIRSDFKRGKINQNEYMRFVNEKIKSAIQFQEEIGLDVLVHGEFERSDMVEYFAENMLGFLLTKNGWVQSYGSRYVKPPIIYGDVSRLKPITCDVYDFAQSCTNKPIKGMLTGPVTIAQWSFVRDDQSREKTCQEIALALRDEILDLERRGTAIIQIDEAAFREALPLRQEDWEHYLQWAVKCFQLCIAGVKDQTQIHTHMCYSKFNDIIHAIAQLDADVLYIETSRSNMAILKSFEHFQYPNSIGPGVYDIHSPRIPSTDEIEKLIETARGVIDYHQLWINPDCGLKTRDWPEAKAALVNMVAAAKGCREHFGHEE